jgi:hypothetical protein
MGADMSFLYIGIGFSIIIIISIIFAFQGYRQNGESDDDIVEMLVSSFDDNCQENTSESILSNKSKIEWTCPECDLVKDDELIRLRRRLRHRSNR